MQFDKILTLSVIVLSLFVLGIGLWLINYYNQQQKPVELVNTDWNTIESRVENDIGTIGYQFIVNSIEAGYTIPAIERQLYEDCLSVYAELRLAEDGLTLEYLAKYNQIVRIRMLRAGIDCQN